MVRFNATTWSTSERVDVQFSGDILTALSIPSLPMHTASLRAFEILFLEGGNCPTVGHLAHINSQSWGRASENFKFIVYGDIAMS